MATIHTGKTQLPDFQRGWVWDDGRIKALIASITNGYPIGAAMSPERLTSHSASKSPTKLVFAIGLSR